MDVWDGGGFVSGSEEGLAERGLNGGWERPPCPQNNVQSQYRIKERKRIRPIWTWEGKKKTKNTGEQ